MASSLFVLLCIARPAHAQQPPTDQAAAQQEPAAEKTAPDFWHRDTMTGDWGGLRTTLANMGITFTANYYGEVFANVQGGIKRGATYDGMFEPQVDVDLDKLLGWKGGSFHASMIEAHGPSISQGWTGNLMTVSSVLAAPPATRLYDLWLQQALFDDRLEVRVGIMNIDAEFITSQTASTFINSTFGWPGWTALELPGGAPAYPLSAPGLLVKWQHQPEGFYLQGAVFDGDPTDHNGSNSPEDSIPSGTVESFRGGALIMVEAGYSVNQGKNAKGPPMTFELGGWYHTSDQFHDQRFDNTGVPLGSPASNGIPLDHHGDWGIYAVADATLYRTTDGGGLSAFARVAGSPGDRNLISFYTDAGLTYKGLIPGRGEDTAGVAIAYARIGNNARGFDQDLQANSNPLTPVRDQETVLEVTYQIQLTPWLTMQPDLQRIFHPGGHVLNPDGSVRRDALVVGLRSMLTF